MGGKARSVRRKRATRMPAILFSIVSEGSVTEANYFQTFERKFGHPTVKMRIVRGAGDPRAVVEKALQEREELRAGNTASKDSVWAVFDRDEHERFSEAVDMARGNKISVATSNPCFELWGIYHYRDFDAPIDRHDCQRLLGELCGAYDRHTHKSFASEELIENGYEEAVRRASVSLDSRKKEGNPGASPCTSVHCLTEEFRETVAKVGRKHRAK